MADLRRPAELETEYILTVEDDVIPPDDALSGCCGRWITMFSVAPVRIEVDTEAGWRRTFRRVRSGGCC